MENAPFFIVGAQRSGTTLLRLMLAAHPRLIIPPESHFVPDLFRFEQRSGGLHRQRSEVVRLLAKHDRLVDFDLGTEWLRETVWRLSPLTTRTITEAIFGEYARRRGKVRWADKTPRYRSCIPELRTIFPEARFLHIVRDGRDTALSAWRAPFGPTTWVGAAYHWRDSIRDVRRGSRILPPERFCEVRYEDLLSDPRGTLERLCAFLGETFHEDMLRHAELAGALVPSWEKTWHAKLERPVSADNAGKWRTQLSAEQIALLERIAGEELTLYGYEVTRPRVSVRSHARIEGQRAHHHFRVAVSGVASLVRPRPTMVTTAYRKSAQETDGNAEGSAKLVAAESR